VAIGVAEDVLQLLTPILAYLVVVGSPQAVSGIKG
jgi:hypothetical protein